MKRRPIRARDGTNQVRGSTKQLLTARQVRSVRRAWSAGETQGEIARTVGISIDTLKARLRDQLADLPKRRQRDGSGRRPDDPTEEEIYGRLTLLEQLAWSDEERSLRWQGSPQVQGVGARPLD